MEWEGSLRGPVGTCQHILALQDIPLHISNYLVVIVFVVFAVCLLSSLLCLLFLLFLLPLGLLRLPLPQGYGAVGHRHELVLRQWSRAIHKDESLWLVPLSRGQHQGVRNSSEKEAREKRAYKVDEPRF